MKKIQLENGLFRYSEVRKHWVIVYADNSESEPQDEDPRYVADLIDSLCDRIVKLENEST